MADLVWAMGATGKFVWPIASPLPPSSCGGRTISSFRWRMPVSSPIAPLVVEFLAKQGS